MLFPATVFASETGRPHFYSTCSTDMRGFSRIFVADVKNKKTGQMNTQFGCKVYLTAEVILSSLGKYPWMKFPLQPKRKFHNPPECCAEVQGYIFFPSANVSILSAHIKKFTCKANLWRDRFCVLLSVNLVLNKSIRAHIHLRKDSLDAFLLKPSGRE